MGIYVGIWGNRERKQRARKRQRQKMYRERELRKENTNAGHAQKVKWPKRGGQGKFLRQSTAINKTKNFSQIRMFMVEINQYFA